MGLIDTARHAVKSTEPLSQSEGETGDPKSRFDNVTVQEFLALHAIIPLPWQKSFVEMLERAVSAQHGSNLDTLRLITLHPFRKAGHIHGTTFNSYILSATSEKGTVNNDHLEPYE